MWSRWPGVHSTSPASVPRFAARDGAKRARVGVESVCQIRTAALPLVLRPRPLALADDAACATTPVGKPWFNRVSEEVPWKFVRNKAVHRKSGAMGAVRQRHVDEAATNASRPPAHRDPTFVRRGCQAQPVPSRVLPADGRCLNRLGGTTRHCGLRSCPAGLRPQPHCD